MVYHGIPSVKNHQLKKQKSPRYTYDTTGFFPWIRYVFLREVVGVFFFATRRNSPFEDSPIDPLDLYLARFTQCLGGILKG